MLISEQTAGPTRPDRVQRQIHGSETNRIPLVRSLARSFGPFIRIQCVSNIVPEVAACSPFYPTGDVAQPLYRRHGFS